jgi:outer membrane protein assembly factor BamE (lipoprotein component of BamABCDE complex)
MKRFAKFVTGMALVASVAMLPACSSVTEFKQLTVAEAAKVTPGQTKEQVRAALGPPMRIDGRNRFGLEVWSYAYYDQSQIEPYRLLWVYFDPASGKVVRTGSGENRSMDPDGGR